jgi:hypothetical protein
MQNVGMKQIPQIQFKGIADIQGNKQAIAQILQAYRDNNISQNYFVKEQPGDTYEKIVLAAGDDEQLLDNYYFMYQGNKNEITVPVRDFFFQKADPRLISPKKTYEAKNILTAIQQGLFDFVNVAIRNK